MTTKEFYADVLRLCDSKNYPTGSTLAVDENGRVVDNKAYAAKMAYALLALYEFVADDSMPTAYVQLLKGGNARIGANSDFWAKCSDLEKWQILLHENTHSENLHFVRSKYIADIDFQGWNIAGDTAGNQRIGLKDGDTIGGIVPFLPKNLGELIGKQLLPWQSTEYYYAEYMKAKKEKQKGDGQGKSGKPTDEPGGFSIPGLIDEHMPQHEIDPIDVELFSEKVRGVYSNAGLINVLPKEVDSGVNWRTVLARLMQKAIRHDSKKTVNRPNRKLNNHLLPKTTRSKKAKITIAVDSSGSMDYCLDKVCAEVAKIVSLHGVGTEFFAMDTQLYPLGTIDRGNVLKAVRQVTGGGGTVFVDTLPLLGKLTQNTPTILITDCDVDWPVNRVRYPLIVIGPEGKTSPYPTITADALFR